MLVIVCLRQNTEVSVSHLREFVAVLLAVSFFFYEGVVDGRFKHCLFCFSALVLLVKGLSVQLTQPVPTVYCGCHQAHGGPNKGGSVSIVLPRIVGPSLGTEFAEGWGLSEEHQGG